jgi:hypothetical protein
MSDDTMTDLVKLDAMVLEDGETIRLWDEETASFLKCEVLHRKLSKKAKSSGHARSWKYKLRMKHNGDVVSTRLVHVKKNKYKMRESKRRGETNATDSTSCSSSSSSMLPKTTLSPTKMVMPMSGNKAKARAIMEGIDVSRICAPMVGGSELAFRLLTRRYGCSLAYTPMISSSRFPLEKEYRDQEFQKLSFFDIGMESMVELSNLIPKYDTIFWNGTLGVVEDKMYTYGSTTLVHLLMKSGKKVIVGGGDTACFVQNNFRHNFHFISTGGGASIDFISNGSLAGIKYFDSP